MPSRIKAVMGNLLNKTKALLKLFRFELCLMGMLSAFVGGLVSGFEYVNYDLFLAMFVVALMVAGSMAINDYFDFEIDKIVHPERPIPSGKVPPKEALLFAVVLFSVSLILSLLINILCLMIVIVSIFSLLMYEVLFKSQGLIGNIIVAFISSMSFTFGGAAIWQPYNSLVLSAITFLLMLGREILMDVRDMEGDILYRETLPMKIGRKSATYFGCAFLIVAIAITPLPALWGILNKWYLMIVIPVDFFIAYAILLAIKSIHNTGKTADMVRMAMAAGLIGFIAGIIP